MKLRLILFVILAALVIVAVINFVNHSVNVTAETVKTNEISQLLKTPAKETSVINTNENNNSDPISDRVAYTVIFRLLSSHKNDVERRRLRGYVKQNLGITDDSEIETFFQVAADFKRRTNPIDAQTASIKYRYHPDHQPTTQTDRKQLDKLKKDKDKIIDDLATELTRRLGEAGKTKFHKNIQERIKQKIKIQE